jgi:hypothetical protein
MSFRKPAATLVILIVILSLAAISGLAFQQEFPEGYTDTPVLPGGQWRVHDLNRPHPPIVTPGLTVGEVPADAIQLFDGTDLSKWLSSNRGETSEPKWKLGDGYFETVPRVGDLITKEKFGDVQLHVEWAAPIKVVSNSQGRGNSGVLLMSLYEIQVLDSYDNVTYADGQAGSIYGQYPPLVNASRKPGEWQSYDIVFEAPVFDGERLVKPAYFTVFHNGVLLHNRQAAMGPMRHRRLTKYSPHEAEAPLMLQGHGNPVRYRNIWIRRLIGYDEQ